MTAGERMTGKQRLGRNQLEALKWLARESEEAMVVFNGVTLRRSKRECATFVLRLQELGLVWIGGRIRRMYQRNDGPFDRLAYSRLYITSAGRAALEEAEVRVDG